MKLMIDGRSLEAMPGQSLLELVQAVGLDCGGLAEKPLAAKISGEVFTLNYIPVRVADAHTEGGHGTHVHLKKVRHHFGYLGQVRRSDVLLLWLGGYLDLV